MAHAKKLRVLFNDSHVNLPGSTIVAQGGPGRFAQTFSGYFSTEAPEVELVSMLFSHNTVDDRIYARETMGEHSFFELVYPRSALLETYTQSYTKKEYLAFLAPWRTVVSEILKQARPDVVFLNGYSLSNWMLLDAAHRASVPVVIQHAGIWKKELLISQDHFSPSIRRIFASLEKEVIAKASLQIFLNEFSRTAFFDLHNTSLTKAQLEKTVIVPLPIEHTESTPMKIVASHPCAVGMVGRWDSIKNHRAMARLGTYVQSVDDAVVLNVVTAWRENLVSSFRDEYKTLVHIHAPMNPDMLRDFYSAQDVIIVPSRFDVSPTVVMEALLAGRPVIISDQVGWVSDYRRVGLDDLIISPTASGSAIAKTIHTLFAKSDQYLPRFRELQAKIINEHSPILVFDTYYKIFKSLAYVTTQ